MVSRMLLAGVGLAAIVACSDSTGPSRLSVAQLAGDWDLDHIDMMLASDTGTHRDVTTGSGIQVSLLINRNGTALLTVGNPGSPDFLVSGRIALRGDTIIWQPEDGSDYGARVHLAGERMTWLSLNTYPYDIDDDGSAEEVYERDVWQRR